MLNMTVAVGIYLEWTHINFYANILYANKSILFPIQEPNHFIIIIISWLNMDIGFDCCYINELDTYAKTWLQLVFPIYLYILVAITIVVSSCFRRFSNFIGRRNPVATLATLILLSYGKLLEVTFRALSYGIVKYPNGTQTRVWLPDANIEYFDWKHTLLFLVSVIILLIGLIYSMLLFSWQWLLCLPGWRIFKWIRNQKLHTLMETYHIPYKPHHRYWTGLLLFARVVLYLVAAVNDSSTSVDLYQFCCWQYLSSKRFDRR